ncbi:hypothetical protein GCM10009682_61360 [Luedemannella flava]|uniref:Uncharacterized protein n=1 Tax=Luedemannella flava TaxID=349316 RepID=A0ABP4YZ40_9ACTN
MTAPHQTGLPGVLPGGAAWGAAPQPAAARTDAEALPLTTGNDEVDAALAALADVADADPAEQVGPLGEALDVLRSTLNSISTETP